MPLEPKFTPTAWIVSDLMQVKKAKQAIVPVPITTSVLTNQLIGWTAQPHDLLPSTTPSPGTTGGHLRVPQNEKRRQSCQGKRRLAHGYFPLPINDLPVVYRNQPGSP